MGISIRRSIAWLPAPHGEPTSTIVLTSPARRFVDIRVTLADQSLEWGFAGTSSYAVIDDAHEKEKGQWRHWVDNQSPLGAEVVDEGVCSQQTDGSMLEVGAMVNPATGAVGDYEEVWDDVDPIVGPAGAAARCVVLQHETATSRGVVELLGVYVQGVLKDESGTVVERWQWTETDDAWKQTFTAGAHDKSLPCATVFEQASALKEGDTVEYKGRSWTVVEAVDV